MVFRYSFFVAEHLLLNGRECIIMSKFIRWFEGCMIRRLGVLIEYEHHAVFRRMYEDYLLHLYHNQWKVDLRQNLVHRFNATAKKADGAERSS